MKSKAFCQGCGTELTGQNLVDIPGYEDFCHACYSKSKPVIVCLDFDGVMSEYDGWKGPEHCGQPMPGLEGFLMNLINWAGHNYRIVVHTTRKPETVLDWLQTHGLDRYVADVTNQKPAAMAYVDDRAIRFNGSFSDLYYELIDFKPWWKSPKPKEVKGNLGNAGDHY